MNQVAMINNNFIVAIRSVFSLAVTKTHLSGEQSGCNFVRFPRNPTLPSTHSLSCFKYYYGNEMLYKSLF